VRSRVLLVALALGMTWQFLASGAGGAAEKKPRPKARPDPAFAQVKDDPALPRVLLIGDSISIGYTPAVRAALAGKANVHRPATNCGPTIRGLAELDKWLGDGRWDVIHFNWGLHDLRVDNRVSHQVPIDQYEKNLAELVQRLQKTGARLIWCRCLWPYYKNQGIGLRILGDPNYYVREIRALRDEARAMKADGVALDVEPYGHSPIKSWFKAGGGLTHRERTALQEAVRAALEEVGQVDFVLPAGSLRKEHPYNVLSSLGESRISETTYTQQAGQPRAAPYPYEIFGAHVSGRKWSFASAGRTCYLVRELLDRSQVWSDKQGLFLYASGADCLQVARDLREYGQAVLAGGARTVASGQ